MPSMPFSVCRTTPAPGSRWSADHRRLADPEVDERARRDVAGDERGQLVAVERSAVDVLDGHDASAVPVTGDPLMAAVPDRSRTRST